MDKGRINASVLEPASQPKIKSVGMLFLVVTILNITMTTSPFSFPLAFKNGGVILGLILFGFFSLLAFNSAQMVVEAISVTAALTYDPESECRVRSHYADKEIESSPYFIRHKAELFVTCKTLGSRSFTIVTMIFLSAFTIGSALVKCVSVSVSLTKALSFALYSDLNKIYDEWPVNPYIISIIFFAIIATIFGLGNIEGSSMLQLTIIYLRIFLLFLMVSGAFYSIAMFGAAKWENITLFDLSNINYIIGNTLYATFLHYGIPGMIYPLRPQGHIQKTFVMAYILQFSLLFVFCLLAVVAFDDKTNTCNHFPCEMNEIYNINFMSLPVIGPFVQFFPALGLSVFPVITISLRNNLMQIFGYSSTSVIRTRTRVIWTLSITIPIYLISMMTTSLKTIINITGGFGGCYLLLFMSPFLAMRARKIYETQLRDKFSEIRIHKPYFSSDIWIYFAFSVGGVVFLYQVISLIYKISS